MPPFIVLGFVAGFAIAFVVGVGIGMSIFNRSGNW